MRTNGESAASERRGLLGEGVDGDGCRLEVHAGEAAPGIVVEAPAVDDLRGTEREVVGSCRVVGEATQYLQRSGTGPNEKRQEGPHAHQVTFDPAGDFVIDIDLGSDTVYTSRLSADGQLEAVSLLEVHPGAGPLHVVFHPGGAAAYVINELDSTLVVCSSSDGELTAVRTLPTRPEDAEGDNLPAEVLISADGRFVYGSNRGDDTIAVFETGAEGLEAELIQTIGSGGSWPRHLAFSKDGTHLYAANEHSGTVALFTVDQSSGALTATGTPLSWPKPNFVLPLGSAGDELVEEELVLEE